MPNFNTLYNHARIPATADFEPSKTQQQFKDEADVNQLLARYKHVELIPVGAREPKYGDFSDPALADYHQAVELVQGVGDLMLTLPAAVRTRFNNDPVQILQFVSDKNNTAEAHALGLLRDDYVSPSATPGPTEGVPPSPSPTPPAKPA